MLLTRLLFGFSVLITVFGLWGSTLGAQPPASAPEPIPGLSPTSNDNGWVDAPAMTVIPRWKGMPWMTRGPQAGVESPYFRDTELGQQTHHGDNGSPAMGYPHQDNRSSMYGLWYRPNGYAGTSHWDQPLSFNPMGYGVPQHREAYRLDYAPLCRLAERYTIWSLLLSAFS